MIPNKTDRTLEGALPGHRIAMSFDANSLAHIMRVLTELYSDPELACVREYATNALDSHRAAGQTRPIEVETPGPLSPYLRIRDFGIGMTMQDIEDIYSRYGASTKRNDNGVTGMLGVGCKSALAYTSQFTLVARRDRVQITVAISRDEDGGGSMTVVDTCSTIEPNGVEVVIPAKGNNAMGSKAATFFSYWEPGMVLLNGKPPAPVEGLQVTPDIKLVASPGGRYSNDPSIVVMGNVPYPVEGGSYGLSHYDRGITSGHHLVVTVPIGSMDFAPSREAIQDSKTTRATLASIASRFKAGLIPAVEREIASAKTPLEAVNAVTQWSGLLGNRRPGSFRFTGGVVPTTINGAFLVTGTRSGRGRSSASTVRNLDIGYFTSAVLVTGFEPDSMTVTHKDKILQWMEENGVTATQIVLCKGPVDTTWFDPAHVVTWLTIKAVKLPKKERLPSGRIPGSYDITIWGGKSSRRQNGVPGDQLDQTKPIFWQHGHSDYEALKANHAEFTIVHLSANRIAKWQRDVPNSISAADETSRLYKAFMDGLTADQKLALHISQNYHERRRLQSFPLGRADELDDPDLVRAVKAAWRGIKDLKTKAEVFGYRVNLDWTNPLENYPLIPSSIGRKGLNHAIGYLNWHFSNAS